MELFNTNNISHENEFGHAIGIKNKNVDIIPKIIIHYT